MAKHAGEEETQKSQVSGVGTDWPRSISHEAKAKTPKQSEPVFDGTKTDPVSHVLSSPANGTSQLPCWACLSPQKIRGTRRVSEWVTWKDTGEQNEVVPRRIFLISFAFFPRPRSGFIVRRWTCQGTPRNVFFLLSLAPRLSGGARRSRCVVRTVEIHAGGAVQRRALHLH